VQEGLPLLSFEPRPLQQALALLVDHALRSALEVRAALPYFVSKPIVSKLPLHSTTTHPCPAHADTHRT
jgi:hypothetical protein